jgi:adenine phosphoribosyltransferase
MTIEEIKDSIVDVPDFPKPGIIFKDITPILEDPKTFQGLAKIFAENTPKETTKLAAIESRGFILASAMAQYLNVGVLLIRKPGKLPQQTLRQAYQLEYGEDQLEIHTHSVNSDDNIAIIDDVLATGGTAEAAEKLVTKAGGKVIQLQFLMELEFLKGRNKLKAPVLSHILL